MKILEKIKFVFATILLFAIIIGVALVDWKLLFLWLIPIIGWPIILQLWYKDKLNNENAYIYSIITASIPIGVFSIMFMLHYF